MLSFRPVRPATRSPRPSALLRTLPCLLLAGAGAQAADIELRLMETTDLHVHALPFDYYQDRATDDVGLARTASLIDAARLESTNSLLFDNGDLLQGNPMGDYVARSRGLRVGDVHPMYEAMNLLGYDAANVGNHEFNYGLEFLLKALAGAEFPYVLANVFEADGDDDPSNDRHYFTPYVLLEREMTDTDGATHDLTVGVIGFTPPQIMQWDKGHLAGRVTVRGIVETAEALVPEMREAGADLVVAIPHSGLATSHPDGLEENATAELSSVEGIDAILFGHAHAVFPSERYEGFPGADLEKGTLNGVPSVMPGFWGSHLGIVDLTLSRADGENGWTVTDGTGSVRSIYRLEEREKIALVESRPDVVAAVRETHEATRAWVGQAVGRITAPINSFFALVQDDPSIQIVTDAQRPRYGERAIEGTEYDGLPRALRRRAVQGGRSRRPRQLHRPARRGDRDPERRRSLHLPEHGAAREAHGCRGARVARAGGGAVQRDRPGRRRAATARQRDAPLVQLRRHRRRRVRDRRHRAARYDDDGALVNEDARRIVTLTRDGAPVADDDEFVVVTNNYRASGGGTFPALDGSTIIVEAPDSSSPPSRSTFSKARARSLCSGRIQISFLTSPCSRRRRRYSRW